MIRLEVSHKGKFRLKSFYEALMRIVRKILPPVTIFFKMLWGHKRMPTLLSVVIFEFFL